METRVLSLPYLNNANYTVLLNNERKEGRNYFHPEIFSYELGNPYDLRSWLEQITETMGSNYIVGTDFCHFYK
jgi:hypothetical protein